MDESLQQAAKRIILPLDYPTFAQAAVPAVELRNVVVEYKIGLEAITAGFAHQLMDLVQELNNEVGWDGKFDDIGNTVAGASKAITKHGVKWFNIHASAGMKSVIAAVENRGKSKVYGVTVLTSIDSEECISTFGAGPIEKVLQFARNLAKAKADGIICSPKEARILRSYPELSELTIVTPGVRPVWADKNDQARVYTPYQAIMDGVDYLVIGRPITRPPAEIGTSAKAVELIAEEIVRALADRTASNQPTTGVEYALERTNQ